MNLCGLELIYVTPLDDDDPDRKRQAEVLLNTYSRDLERRRLSAGAQGLLISDYGNAFNYLVVRHCRLTFYER